MNKKTTHILLTAAVLLSTTGATMQAQRSRVSKTGTELFTAHFNPVPLRAMDSFPSQYQVSRQELARLKKDSADLYTGIVLLRDGETAKALPYLQRTSDDMKNTVTSVSEWYLALAFLKMGKRAQAEYLFHKIAETEIHPHQDEAELVYQQLLQNSKRN